MTDMIKRIRAVVLNGCKQYKWICISWAFLLLIVLPTRMLMFSSHDSAYLAEEMIRYAQELQSFMNPLLLFYLLLAPLVSVLIIFSHLHQKNRVDLVHQLPVTRLDLLIGRGMVAYFSVWIPLMVTGIVIYALRGLTPQFMSVLEWKYLLGWMVHGSIFLLLHTSIVIFMGFLTGMIATHGLFTIIAYLFPLGIYLLTLGNMSMLVQTYEFSFDVSRRFSWFLPIMRISLEDGFPFLQDVVYLMVGLLIFMGAYLLYRVRDLEVAGNVIAFDKLNRLFKFGMGFSFMLVGGPFFYTLASDMAIWLYIGYALGGLFGFFIAQVLIQKSFHVLHHWKSFLVFACASALLITGMRLDLLGVKNWQPKAESIEAINISGMSWYYYDKDQEAAPLSITVKEKTLALQAAMIRATLPEDTMDANRVYTYYRLDHGGQSRRSYTLDETFMNTTYRAYLADPEVMKMNFPILTTNKNAFVSATISSSLMPGRVISLRDGHEIRMLVEALGADIKAIQSDSYRDYQPSTEDATFAYIHLMDQDGSTILDMPIKNWYAETTTQLDITHRLDRLVLTPDDVEDMVIHDWKDDRDDRVITDPAAIEALVSFINERGDRPWGERDYEFIIHFKDREISNLYYTLDRHELPVTLQN